MVSTDLEVRRTLDLTRSPSEQWNAEMLQVVARNVFRGMEITESQLYYCLSVAESLDLNPMVNEIYFIPGKSRDGKGPAYQPYIGRNGLVKKARQRSTYYESDTVHANDKFRIVRKATGERTCTHSYGSEDRGAIVGAYAFLHDDDGRRIPAFFYAKLTEYEPTFDQDWKAKASPWGNQTSAMIEKCAMIGAGRKRLDLGNVLADGEVARVQQQQAVGPGTPAAALTDGEFDWSQLDAGDAVIERLRQAVDSVNEIEPLTWAPAKLEMLLSGKSEDELVVFAEQIEAEHDRMVDEMASPAEPEEVDGEPVETPDSPPAPRSDVETPQDAVLVDADHVAALTGRAQRLEESLRGAEPGSREFDELIAELDGVIEELAAAENPDQPSLLG